MGFALAGVQTVPQIWILSDDVTDYPHTGFGVYHDDTKVRYVGELNGGPP